MANRIRHFLSELRRRKVYHVAVVYIVVGLGVAQGAEWFFSLLELPPVWSQVSAGIVLLGFPLALVLAWAFEIRPEKPAPESSRDKDAVAIPAQARSIAVLPFESLSSDPEGDYFADGITEELTNALAKQKGLRVAARTSAFAFKGERADIREIGKKLNVAHVIEGSVRRSDTALRITAQLIDISDGYHLWSDQFDRVHGDVFEIQEEIAGCVVRRLLDDVAEDEVPQISKANLSAYDSFLKGRHGMAAYGPADIADALAHFETAIQLDDRFAPALAGLAEALTVQAIGFSIRPSKETMPRAGEVASRALELDPNLPEAHLARALFNMYWEWEYPAAKKGMDRALYLNPNSSSAHHWTEFYWTYVEYDFERAVAANRRAKELNPLDRRLQNRLGTVHYLFGRYEEAEEILTQELAVNPDDPTAHLSLADTLTRMERFDEAVSSAEKAVELAGRHHAFLGIQSMIYGLQGNREAAEEILAELEGLRREGGGSPFWVGVAYSGVGRMERAFSLLDQAVEERDGGLLFLPQVPRQAGLCEDPRFFRLLERIRLGHLARLFEKEEGSDA